MLYKTKFSFRSIVIVLLVSLSGCAVSPIPPDIAAPTLSPRGKTYQDLHNLPKPKGKIVASVYSFRDQTGQYKPAPSSSFSTAVTQGATAMLAQALQESGWFLTLEREGLQNLLTERKIIRAAQKKSNTPSNNSDSLPSLLSANVLIEGGIVGFDTNIETGGAGARYLGIGVSEQYRVDQVTVNLRAVDVRTGQILNNVSTTKTILSKELRSGIFKYVDFKDLLEIESGVTSNEPAQNCVRAAIESAVIHIIVDGIDNGSWSLGDDSQLENEVIKRYREETPNIASTADHAPNQLNTTDTASHANNTAKSNLGDTPALQNTTAKHSGEASEVAVSEYQAQTPLNATDASNNANTTHHSEPNLAADDTAKSNLEDTPALQNTSAKHSGEASEVAVSEYQAQTPLNATDTSNNANTTHHSEPNLAADDTAKSNLEDTPALQNTTAKHIGEASEVEVSECQAPMQPNTTHTVSNTKTAHTFKAGLALQNVSNWTWADEPALQNSTATDQLNPTTDNQRLLAFDINHSR